MKSLPLFLMAFILSVHGSTALAQSAPLGFDGAKWIWAAAVSGDTGSCPAGTCYFRGEVNIPESPALKSAEVIVTCDNLFVLYLNGRPVGESETDMNAWNRAKRWDLTDLLVPGRSVLAIEAVNTLPGPAGVLIKFVAEMADGTQISLSSGPDFKGTHKPTANWQQPDFDDQKWPVAAVVARFGDGPWGKVVVPADAATGGGSVGKVQQAAARALRQGARQPAGGGVVEQQPPEDYRWPEAVVFVGDDCSLYRDHGKRGTAYDSLGVTIFNPRRARTFPEHDLPAPMKVGHKLYALTPARPGVEPKATGVLYCQNVRFTQKTTAGWENVRAIRVLAGKGLTKRSSHSYIVHAGNETVELGTVPLASDGSFAVEVPADTPIALQAVDAEWRSELNEMSWVYLRPGEQRGCVGCHHKRQATPLFRGAMPLAMQTRPLHARQPCRSSFVRHAAGSSGRLAAGGRRRLSRSARAGCAVSAQRPDALLAGRRRLGVGPDRRPPCRAGVDRRRRGHEERHRYTPYGRRSALLVGQRQATGAASTAGSGLSGSLGPAYTIAGMCSVNV